MDDKKTRHRPRRVPAAVALTALGAPLIATSPALADGHGAPHANGSSATSAGSSHASTGASAAVASHDSADASAGASSTTAAEANSDANGQAAAGGTVTAQ